MAKENESKVTGGLATARISAGQQASLIDGIRLICSETADHLTEAENETRAGALVIEAEESLQRSQAELVKAEKALREAGAWLLHPEGMKAIESLALEIGKHQEGVGWKGQ